MNSLISLLQRVNVRLVALGGFLFLLLQLARRLRGGAGVFSQICCAYTFDCQSRFAIEGRIARVRRSS